MTVPIGPRNQFAFGYRICPEIWHLRKGNSGFHLARSLQCQGAMYIEMPTRVLFVDEDPNVLRLYRALLEGTATKVLTAHDVEQTMALIRIGIVDVVVTDFRMAEQDGAALIGEIQSYDADLPVLLVTPDPRQRALGPSLDRRATRFLQAPIDRAALRQAISSAGRAYLGRRRHSRLDRDSAAP